MAVTRALLFAIGLLLMAITTLYGPQDWTAGTFNVTTPDTGDGSYPLTVYREEVKTVDASGPASERILDSDDYGASAHDEQGFGPSSGFFDARGANDGEGVFYEGDVFFSSAVEAAIGDFAYPFNIGVNGTSSGQRFFQFRTALTEGALYIWVRGDGEDATSASISADDAWHRLKAQIVPSSDNGDTMQDGIVRVWLDDVLVYETLTSWAWVPEVSQPLYHLNYVYYGHFGILPSTNWHIYYGTEDVIDLSEIPTDESTPCCGSTGASSSPGATLGSNPFEALQPWTRSCAGGGTVPSAADLTDSETWLL
jgi:hypothetical protein